VLAGSDTTPLYEVVVRSAIIFVVLLVGLRLTGKRQSAHVTLFDLILILLIANAAQNAMVGTDTSLVGGLVAMGTLLGVNSVIAWFSRRSKKLGRLIQGVPTILIRHGEVIAENLRREGMGQDDLLRALREHGVEDAGAVRTAILEVDGTISVLLKREDPATAQAHHQIQGVPRTNL
jgi:uncharacterized membrane protein YcaP (DUF421 family)